MIDITCPNCGAPEVNPETGLLFIRALKVDNNSHCMRCHIWFDLSGNIIERCSQDCYCWEFHSDPNPLEYRDPNTTNERIEISARA